MKGMRNRAGQGPAEKAERLLPSMSPADQTEVKRLMGEVHTALTDRRWDKVVSSCNGLSDVLFYLEEV